PYGHTKLLGEQLIRAAAQSHGISSVTLRYFNAAGADNTTLAEHEGANLIPILLRSLVTGDRFVVAGSDHPTPDGTPVRDYVHVADLADVTVAGVEALARGCAHGTFNVGSGRGHSVREVIDRIASVTGLDVPYRLGARRPGDPSEVVADRAALTRAFH